MTPDCGLKREEAFNLLNNHLKTENLVNHCIASEAILRAIATEIDENKDSWGIAGLLHDIDLDEVKGDMELHGDRGADILKDKGLKEPYLKAIRLHKQPADNNERQTPLEHGLAAGETITGLIVATALVQPDKKIGSVKPKSIKKRMKETRFAAGACRNIIRECEKIPIELERFIQISVDAMKDIASDIGM